jgi:hypothetical protein
MRTLFWIASTNFVFPVVLNVVQIAFSHSNKSDYIQVANTFVTAYCAVLASGLSYFIHWLLEWR